MIVGDSASGGHDLDTAPRCGRGGVVVVAESEFPARLVRPEDADAIAAEGDDGTDVVGIDAGP